MRLRYGYRRWLILFFCAAWIGCSAKSSANYGEEEIALSRQAAAGSVLAEGDAAFDGTGYAETAVPVEEAVPAAPVEGGRKLVRRAVLRIRAQDPAEVEKAVTTAMAKYGAYAAATAIDDNSRYFTIRVPAASYQAFLADIGGLGRVLSRSENAEDVTVRYYDLEGRLATKRELLKTFRVYLGKAATIEDILSVEKRIAELEDEIDGTGRELRALGNLVDYATVELEVYGPVTSSSYQAPAFGERLIELLDSFGGFASTLALVLVGIVIFGIPVVLILTVLFWVLFGKIGLLKKLWRAAAGKKTA
ncbi:MAG: DUF4349 domain-containing protein [Treponema sp.]|nr:DUF4349 domain-containing protein [Treponema sp.]